MFNLFAPRPFPHGSRPRGRRLRFPHHGLLIFLAQILLVVIVPLSDSGKKLAPASFAIAAQATTVATIFLLGYRRVGSVVAIVSVLALGWGAIHLITLEEVRLPPALVLIGTYIVGVLLCVQHAFLQGVDSKQRIYCGCAGFLMVGMAFAGAHALSHVMLGTEYFLPKTIEGMREIRWIDFVWLSYATLTTAGFSDMVPVGSLPLLLCTLEGLCGILFPATLIARIASLPAEAPWKQRHPTFPADGS